MRPRVIVVLDTMWGDRCGSAPRWFSINPLNRSGARLRYLIPEPFVVTNVCREMTDSATRHGRPDREWLMENLMRFSCSRKDAVAVVCGNVAKRAWNGLDLQGLPIVRIVSLPHPAARMWTAALEEAAHSMILAALL